MELFFFVAANLAKKVYRKYYHKLQKRQQGLRKHSADKASVVAFRVSYATEQGSRPYQEDRLAIRQINADNNNNNNNFGGIILAVADGHGGDETSSFVTEELSAGLFDRMLAKTKNNDVEEALRQTFRYLNDATYELSEKKGLHYESGSTLSVVFLPESQERAHVAVIGDSPVIHASKGGTAVHVSPEHNARTNENERKEAILRGGRFIDGYIMHPFGSRGLQMARDIGLHAMGNVLNREPEIYSLAIQEGDIIILASDGLLDPAHENTKEMEDEAKRLARLVLEQGAEANELVNDAISRQTGDNVTAIVYRR
jgi:serine/threonine protein phosphatase PrpC